MKKTSDFDTSLIRHDYKRAVYRAMLSELPPGEIIEFFHSSPLIVEGEQIQGKRLFDLLWAEKGKITCEFDYRLDNHLERFLISKNRDPATILKKVLWLNNNSTHIPGKILLTWFYPKLETIPPAGNGCLGSRRSGGRARRAMVHPKLGIRQG